jgi:hypothetical protein
MNDDDLEALRMEYFMFQSPGWEIFKATMLEKFHENSGKLSFGTYKDDRDRLHSEGQCQLYKFMLDHEAGVKAAYQAIQEEAQQATEKEAFEGGDHGVHYEAAQ